MKTKEEILKDQVGSYTFDELIDNEPGIMTAMEEYAKQQAIAFVKWAIESEKIMGDNYYNAFIPGPEEELYDQFIESQNK
jgi:hypothetical protein